MLIPGKILNYPSRLLLLKTKQMPDFLVTSEQETMINNTVAKTTVISYIVLHYLV